MSQSKQDSFNQESFDQEPFNQDKRSRSSSPPPAVLEKLAEKAGIRFNGDQPWDIQVFDDEVYRRVLSQGSLAFGESYMDGWWEAEALDEVFHRILRANVEHKIGGMARLKLAGNVLRQKLLNLQRVKRAYQVGERHYDIGNDVFQAMLDPTMSYSCGYWANADTLAQAQTDKLDLVCRKLKLEAGEKVLDIGCGWGGFAHHAATHYGVEVHGITISKEQQKLAQEYCRGLPVTIELQDYRKLQGQFDKIVSIGMFEHVGPKNYHTYFKTALRLLKSNGLFLLHTIGAFRTTLTIDPWINKYIFPNGKLPSITEIGKAINGRFVLEDWHNFGPDYDKTLMAWWQRFNDAWPKLSNRELSNKEGANKKSTNKKGSQNYDERFYRMFKYYLHCSAGLFRSKQGQLWQLVLSKRENQGTYRSVR